MEIDHRKIERIVPKKFHQWIKVFGKIESKRMPVRKVYVRGHLGSCLVSSEGLFY